MNVMPESGLSCRITGVESEDIPKVWAKVEGLLSSALEYAHGEYELQDIYVGLCCQNMQLWIGYRDTEIEGVMVTEIHVHPRKRYLFIVLLAGKSPERWEHGWPIVEKWAMELGLDGVRTLGRRGFERHSLSKVTGLKPLHTLYGADFITRRMQ